MATTIVPALVRFTPRPVRRRLGIRGRLGIAQVCEEVAHATDAGQHGLGVDLQPRPEHERPLRRARVRQGQRRIVRAHVAVGDEVEIERAALPAEVIDPARRPAVRLLDRVEVAQHGGGEAGRHERDRVEVGGRLGIRTVQRQRDRFDGRGGDDARRQRQARELFEGRRHRRLPVAQVGADRDRPRRLGGVAGGHVVGEALREAAVHAGTPSRARRIVTLTSSNGTVMGACGLWIVTSTASTRAREERDRRCAGRRSRAGPGSPESTAATWSANSP
jgi:hypothetical protein